MKFSIKNMKFSIKNMKFSVYEVCQNSSFVLFVTEFSYHMYRKNAVLNGKQKQMKPLPEKVWLDMKYSIKQIIDLDFVSFSSGQSLVTSKTYVFTYQPFVYLT